MTIQTEAPSGAGPAAPSPGAGPAPEAAGLVPGAPVPAGASSRILLGRYQNTQGSIAVRAAAAIVGLWNRYVDPAHFADSWKRLNPLVNGIVATHYGATAANAAQFYAHSRVTAGFGPATVPGAELDPTYLNRVTNSMGPGQFFHFLKENDAPTSSTMAADALRGASTRLVLKGGRDTITGATVNDPVATGWERVITPGACSFCAMLAGRGAVYKSDTADFRAHDHCHCVARPVFRGQESVNAALSDEWGIATKGTRGGAQARAAWDKYWSSRGEPIRSTAQEPTEARPGHAAIAGQRK